MNAKQATTQNIQTKNIYSDLVQDFEHVKWGMWEILGIIAKHISSIDGWVLKESTPCLKDHVLGWQQCGRM